MRTVETARTARTALLVVVSVGALIACGEKAPAPGSGAAKDTAAASTTAAPAAAPAPAVSPLLNPDPAKLNAVGPDSFAIHFVTSKGAFDVKVHRDWAPHGADRVYYLVSNGFYDGAHFFRVLDGFMAQFGINGNPAVNTAWSDKNIPDDPVKKGNQRGIMTFAMAGPDTRRTQLFINYSDNSRLDKDGFSGLGAVVSGMPVVDSLYHVYGEGPPDGLGPSQGRIERQGNAYLDQQFPLLDSIVTAKVSQEWRAH